VDLAFESVNFSGSNDPFIVSILVLVDLAFEFNRYRIFVFEYLVSILVLVDLAFEFRGLKVGGLQSLLFQSLF